MDKHKCLENYNYFNDFIDDFDGLRNVKAEKDLDIARQVIDVLMDDVNGSADEDIN